MLAVNGETVKDWGPVWVPLVVVGIAALAAHFYKVRQWRYERRHDACVNFLGAVQTP